MLLIFLKACLTGSLGMFKFPNGLTIFFVQVQFTINAYAQLVCELDAALCDPSEKAHDVKSTLILNVLLLS